ncbi:hypothetical protein L0B53_12130 [Vibrio sp. SS-MA-C1-2]|uniref:hypothetical protein n=1 Tax=Vibrio sp. SS-MA-C1-2 TaxID=2908646 RepID=UPI001F430082|nr:hypothetical protein [Vibrio sp. SS-MA-C1-2]UJF17775.1 hypothetical protein L0B53_12130 [Vibrio sp. SS-MA-C1-2]
MNECRYDDDKPSPETSSKKGIVTNRPIFCLVRRSNNEYKISKYRVHVKLNYSFAAQSTEWQLVEHETFDRPFTTENADWLEDKGGETSSWYIDDFDDFGKVWNKISDPQFTKNMGSMKIFRQRVVFSDNGWLTAEVAAQDKDADGKPDSKPKAHTVKLANGESGLKLDEPSWDSGVIIRPTKPLPAQYRVEMTLRKIDFGGKRNGSFEYEDKFNGYSKPSDCKTNFPWTFKGSPEDKTRCASHNVTQENGFYYLTILDHANPSPQGNPGIHLRRKVVVDGYFSDAEWSQDNGVCNPKTGEIYGIQDSTFNGVNAIFVLGNKFRKAPFNEYFFRTACGDYRGDEQWGTDNKYTDILTSAELQPELLPEKSYTFAVERDEGGYTIEMTGPFRHVGQTTLRYHHKFIEEDRPIWHYNQTAEEYDGQFNGELTHNGYAAKHIQKNIWPKGSAYPDTFIIGDPHLNFYEGSAIIDDIKLFVKSEDNK